MTETLDTLAARHRRTANTIFAVSVLVVTIAFIGSIAFLFKLDGRIAEKKAEIGRLEADLTKTTAARDALQSEYHELVREREILNAKLREQKMTFRQINQDFQESILYFQARKYSDALVKIKEIVARDPDNEVAHFYLAHAYFRLGKYDDSIQSAQKAITLDPYYSDPLIPLICSLAKKGNHRNGSAYLSHYLAADLSNINALLGWKRELDELMAIREYRQVIVAHQNRIAKIQEGLKAVGLYSCRQCAIDARVGVNTLEAARTLMQSAGANNRLALSDIERLLASTRTSRVTGVRR